jgi:hypothetical protein
MTAWINHVKDFAKSKGVSYRSALKDPQCSASYKGKGKESLPKTEVAVETTPEVSTPKKRGRPRKYPTPEVAKEAKKEMTVKSNKKKRQSKKEEKGAGLIVPVKTEEMNGLGHIYPISHAVVIKMLSL